MGVGPPRAMLLGNTVIGVVFGLIGAASVQWLCAAPEKQKSRTKQSRARDQRTRRRRRRQRKKRVGRGGKNAPRGSEGSKGARFEKMGQIFPDLPYTPILFPSPDGADTTFLVDHAADKSHALIAEPQPLLQGAHRSVLLRTSKDEAKTRSWRS